MSEWNYTKCAKPFESADQAKQYLLDRDFAGHILKRSNGYAAVCPTYPEGYYPDAELVESIDNRSGELAGNRAKLLSNSCCE
jgi:hypothetical protein